MIPQDVITEILLRLPVKSLLRCKSVCKPWLSLISNPNFINSHLKHTLTNSDGAEQTLLLYERNDNIISLLNLNSRVIEPPLPLGFPFPKGDYTLDPNCHIIDSYNGIVCVSVTDYARGSNEWLKRYIDYLNNRNTYLWNPATKRSKLIPPHNIRENVKAVDLGFGFDPVSNDFKVVRIVRYDTNSVTQAFAAEVYSANTNVWREVDPSPTDNIKYDTFDVCVNGFLCSQGSRGMIAFDLDKEVFTCGINLPATYMDYCISEFNDSIAVVTFKEGESNCIIQLWTLDNEACLRGGGVEASWTVMLTFDVDFPDPRVYGCFKSGDFVLHTDDNRCLLYNSYKKEARNVPVSILIGHRIIRYNESLISIPGSKQVDWNTHEDDN